MARDVAIVAYLDDFGYVRIEVSHRFYQGNCSSFYLRSEDGSVHDCVIRQVINHKEYTQYDCTVPPEHDFSKSMVVIDNHGRQVPLQIRFVVRKPLFHEKFTYNGNDLGPQYQNDQTTFKVWAPTATNLVLALEVDGKTSLHPMIREEKGIYQVVVQGDLHQAIYSYYVSINGGVIQTTDPYALSSTANGGKSAVVDLNRIEKSQKNSCGPLESWVDAILYECSVRDLTISKTSGATTHGTYEAFVEKGTKYHQHKTGFDYIRELGVTHVQLMPVYDFATVDEENSKRQYNWGYDPLHYYGPEGSFSSNPNDPYARVQELRKLVDSFHEAGLRVTMDIVINHHYDVGMSALHRLVPYYYFRYNDQGQLSNGSYCGNDFSSVQPMARKYLVDHLLMWIDVYGMDGFRFDLMGIIDVDTMNLVVKKTKEKKPECMIYGEGWNMPTALDDRNKAMIANNEKMPQVGHFNDMFRDSIKGKSMEGHSYEKGYCTGDGDFAFNVASCLAGSVKAANSHKIFQQPHQTINYIECHDNQTSWDKMKDCCKEDTREVRLERQKMMIACTLLAQGVPFLHCGQEFCRTKLGYHNSYNSPDSINQVDWERMIRYEEVVRYTKTCISIRKNFEAFRLRTAKEIEENVSFEYLDGNVLKYTIQHTDSRLNCKGIVMIINPFGIQRNFCLQQQVKVILDNQGFNAKSNRTTDVVVQPHSVLVCAIV